jgi:hypothetical protein
MATMIAGPLAGSVPAQAPPGVRVVSAAATIHTGPRPRSEVVMTATPGTVLEVMDKDGDWYWIYLPPDSFGTRRPGWIAARDVEIVTREAPDTKAPGVEAGGSAERRPDRGRSSRAAEARPSRALIRAERELEEARREYEQLLARPNGGSSRPAPPPSGPPERVSGATSPTASR